MVDQFSLQTLIGSYGFPIVMCGWFAFRMETLIKANTDAITKLALAVVSCPIKKDPPRGG